MAIRIELYPRKLDRLLCQVARRARAEAIEGGQVSDGLVDGRYGRQLVLRPRALILLLLLLLCLLRPSDCLLFVQEEICYRLQVLRRARSVPQLLGVGV